VQNDEAHEGLRTGGRTATATGADHPPTPWWYPVGFGLWAAAMTIAFTVLDDTALKVPAVLALIVVELGFLRWYVRHRQGAGQTTDTAPAGPEPHEFRGPIALFVTAAVAVLAGVAALTSWVGPWAAAAFALVATTAVVTWYERAYADAVRRGSRRAA
jgi:hypothetical protein